MKKAIREVIVVEGRYDKNALSQVVDATIITLGGFAVFNDREKLAFLRRLAEQFGQLLLGQAQRIEQRTLRCAGISF